MNRDRHISRLVGALVFVAIAAGVTTVSTMGQVLDRMRTQRTQATAAQTHLREHSDAFQKLAARIREASQFRTRSDCDVQSPAAELTALVGVEMRNHSEPGIREVLRAMHEDAEALSDLLEEGAAWRVRWRAAMDDQHDQRSAGEARRQVMVLRRAVQDMAGRGRLDTTLRALRWAESVDAGKLDANSRRFLFDAMLQNQDLDGLSTDLSELERLVEVLNGEPSLDRLADLVNNEFLPTLGNIERTVGRLVEQDPSIGDLSLEAVRSVGDSIFGVGYSTDPVYQILHPGKGGLLALRRETLQLERDLSALEARRVDLTDQLDEHASDFKVVSERLTSSLVQQAESSLQRGWWISVCVASLCGVLFLWLAWLINRGIRRQVVEVENQAAELARQIQQREAAERSIETLRHTHETILNTIGEGIYWMDTDGEIRFANPAAASQLGRSVDEMIGQPAHDLIHHSHVDGSIYPASQSPVYCMIRDGKPRRVDDEVFWRKDGTPFAVEYTSTPVLDGSGAICGAVVVFTNIAERKAIEAQQAHTLRLESIGQLAAGIAHEINTPTQYVSDNVVFLQAHFEQVLRLVEHYTSRLAGNAESWADRKASTAALMEELDYEFLRREIPLAIGQSMEGLERVSTIVRAMKDFSHPGSDEKEATDLNRSIRSTVEVCRARWKYVAELELDLEPTLPKVECLVADFNQVILNLVVNAADAISEKVAGKPDARGHIRVTTRMAGEDAVEIRVSDDGGGIPKAVQPRIFEQFFTTKRVGVGTGQGLALSRRVIVERHGGQIRFETEEGVGTTFIIQLPLSAQSGQGERQPGEEKRRAA